MNDKYNQDMQAKYNSRELYILWVVFPIFSVLENETNLVKPISLQI